jgi:hypothetical protein
VLWELAIERIPGQVNVGQARMRSEDLRHITGKPVMCQPDAYQFGEVAVASRHSAGELVAVQAKVPKPGGALAQPWGQLAGEVVVCHADNGEQAVPAKIWRDASGEEVIKGDEAKQIW